MPSVGENAIQRVVYVPETVGSGKGLRMAITT